MVVFYYKVVGKGTQLLSEMKNKQEVKILGPLGNGYNLKPEKVFTPIVVAGGTGIASMRFLCQKLGVKGRVFYGAKSKKDIIGLDIFRKNKWKIGISTDDGTQGFKGFVTKMCSDFINKEKCENYIVYTCGPTQMLKEVVRIAKEHKIPGQISLEEKMACGIGICQGCVVKVKGEYIKVCEQGPVFDISSTNI